VGCGLQPRQRARRRIRSGAASLLRPPRERDPRGRPAPHPLLDGNHYSTDFDVFRDPIDNADYTCHDYARAGFARSSGHPGETDGIWIDKEQVEETFLRRTAYMRETNTPVRVGEFGPVYTGDPAQKPFSTRQWMDVLLRHILLGQPLVQEYAGLFRGLRDDDVLALADSFALERCERRDWLLNSLASG